MSTDPLSQAIEAAGGLQPFAALCDVRYQAVQKWRRNGVSPHRAAQIEDVTRGLVRCEQLCPDVIWQRDTAGRVTGYTVPIEAAAGPRAEGQTEASAPPAAAGEEQSTHAP